MFSRISFGKANTLDSGHRKVVSLTYFLLLAREVTLLSASPQSCVLDVHARRPPGQQRGGKTARERGEVVCRARLGDKGKDRVNSSGITSLPAAMRGRPSDLARADRCLAGLWHPNCIQPQPPTTQLPV